MVRKTITIYNLKGLHLRPAGQVCQKAMEFESKVEMVIGEKQYNMKSVLSVLSAQISTSRDVDLICSGPDEEQAMEAMAAFLGEDLEKKPEEGKGKQTV